MSPLADAFLRSWPHDGGLAAMLLLTAAIYLRGWRTLCRHDAVRWHAGRAVAFLAGLATVYLAVASPIESFAPLLLQLHMLQHLLLLVVAPPLIWIGAPLLPMLRGLPKPIRTVWIAPLVRSPLSRRLSAVLTDPLVAWPVFVAVIWLWHSPRGYELALDYRTWHIAEHASFLMAAMMFWYPVVLPYPARARHSRWIIFPYLILADVQNTLLSAWLAFAAEPIYVHYTEVPRIGGWSPLADQQAAAMLMWVPGSLAFLLPVFWIGLRMLYGSDARRRTGVKRPVASLAVLPVISTCSTSCGGSPRTASARVAGYDLLDTPLVGRFFRWHYSRPVLQLVMLALAMLVIVDGLLGPQLGAANLAGVAPWIHWRGLVVLGLLVGGNLFCLACPFTLPRKLAARWLPAGRPWPRACAASGWRSR